MPNAQNYAIGGLEFLRGLSESIVRNRQLQRQEDLQLLQGFEKAGTYQLTPVSRPERAGFWQRLGGVDFQPRGGVPVVQFGSSALTAQPLPRLTPERTARMMEGLDLSADEQGLLSSALSPYVGLPLNQQTVKDVAAASRDTMKLVVADRREQAKIDRETQKDLQSLKITLLGDLRGRSGAGALTQQIRQAANADQLLSLYPQLPSAQQLKVDEFRALRDERLKEYEQMSPLHVDRARQTSEATEPSKLRVAEAQGARAAEIAAGKPLEGESQKHVASLSAMLEQLADVSSLYQKDYVGSIAGRVGGGPAVRRAGRHRRSDVSPGGRRP